MFDTPNRKVPVNFFLQNFQDIIFIPSRVAQEWFRDHLKKWPFSGPDPLHVDTLILIPTFIIYVFSYSRQTDRQTDKQIEKLIRCGLGNLIGSSRLTYQ
jgi:hypothetical protein